MTLKTIGEIIGFVAIAEGFLLYISTKRKTIFTFRMISCGMWATSYLLQGAIPAGCNSLIGFTRDTVFRFRGEKKWADSKLWLVLFIFLSILVAIINCVREGAFSVLTILPTVGTSVLILCNFSKNTLLVKCGGIFCGTVYLVYTAIVGSISGIFGNSVVVISSVIGIIREIIKMKREKAEAALSAPERV